ncbi:hypothetical protein CW304_23245 [Bacillus sp. UFRGS-B20]|nr:hypothetical protein CW304_23245 [Bacillus sp. UFRGS-B20]
MVPFTKYCIFIVDCPFLLKVKLPGRWGTKQISYYNSMLRRKNRHYWGGVDDQLKQRLNLKKNMWFSCSYRESNHIPGAHPSDSKNNIISQSFENEIVASDIRSDVQPVNYAFREISFDQILVPSAHNFLL